MPRSLCLLRASALLIGLAASARAVQPYQMIDLGLLPGATMNYSSATGINDLGQIVGVAEHGDTYHAFCWTSGGGMEDLSSVLGGGYCTAEAVNNAGQIAAYSSVGSEAIVWSPAGGKVVVASNGRPFGISDSGIVVGGRYWGGYGTDYGAFLWSPSAGLIRIPKLDASRSSWAYGVNDGGEVVGESYTPGGPCHAYRWTQEGGTRDLGTLGGSVSSASDVNNLGEIVGSSWTVSGSDCACIWDTMGRITSLGYLPGHTSSRANAIGDQGLVVGMSWSGYHGDTGRAFLWSAADGMVDLGTLPGATASEAYAINSLGQIAGCAYYGADNLRHAVLWQPIPEPATLLLLALSGLALVRPSGRPRALQRCLEPLDPLATQQSDI